jgi:hypothetical protein
MGAMTRTEVYLIQDNVGSDQDRDLARVLAVLKDLVASDVFPCSFRFSNTENPHHERTIPKKLP